MVLGHGHFDHDGGFPRLARLRGRSGLPLTVHPHSADGPCQDIKTSRCSLTTKCDWLICAASRQQQTTNACGVTDFEFIAFWLTHVMSTAGTRKAVGLRCAPGPLGSQNFSPKTFAALRENFCARDLLAYPRRWPFIRYCQNGKGTGGPSEGCPR